MQVRLGSNLAHTSRRGTSSIHIPVQPDYTSDFHAVVFLKVTSLERLEEWIAVLCSLRHSTSPTTRSEVYPPGAGIGRLIEGRDPIFGACTLAGCLACPCG